jgi:small subunit ribosomal protein S4
MVKKLKKQYETPNEGWNQERIDFEDNLSEKHGLKNKREVYKAQSQLRDFRRQARKLAASQDESQTEEFLSRVNRLGLIRERDSLEDVLSLNVEDILNRRLQTAVNRKGLTDTVTQARQHVVHGHVYIDGQRVTVPGYLLTQEKEQNIELKVPENESEEEETEEVEESEEQDEDVEEAEDETSEEDQEEDEE